MLRTKHTPKTNVSLPKNKHLFMILKYKNRFFSTRAFQSRSSRTQQDHLKEKLLARNWTAMALAPEQHPWATTAKGSHHLGQLADPKLPDTGFECLHGDTRNRPCPITAPYKQHLMLRCEQTDVTLHPNNQPGDRYLLSEPLQSSYSCLDNACDTFISSCQYS